jgi:uncharacterized protein (TIGR00266 family)
MTASDVIDHRLIGNELQAVVITLDPGEQVLAEAGAMLYMTDGIDMQTSTATGGGEKKGFFGKMFKAAGRALAGESFFITTFTNTGSQRADVGFAAPYPGKIVPIPLAEYGGTLLCQKDAFLCAARGTEISIAFQKKLGAGLFGGEGFILQKLEGDGLACIHAGGSVFPMDLQPGQKLRVDTGCVVAMQSSVNYDIEFVGGFKNALFGGEGMFFATLEGPGRVFLQTMPLSRLADRINAASSFGGDTGESTLGSLFSGD